MNQFNDLRTALLPFAKAAADYEPPTSSRAWRDEEHIALSLTVGHVRNARRVYLKAQPAKEGVNVSDDKTTER